MIKKMTIEDIRNDSLKILTRTVLELRLRSMTEDDLVSLSLILAEDLQEDFGNLEMIDISKAFRRGVRKTDEFLIGPKVWYIWIKQYRDLLWDAQYQVRTQGADPKKVPYYKPKQKLIQ